MNKYLDDGRKFVLTEQGYKHTPDNVKRERKVNEPIIGYETKVFYRLMRGSHTYDSREMSELIKGTIQEAEDLGIETLTPRELEQIIGKWKPRKEEEK